MKFKILLVKAFAKDKSYWKPAWVIFNADFSEILDISKKYK